MANLRGVGFLRMNMSSNSEYCTVWMPISQRAICLCAYTSTGQGSSLSFEPFNSADGVPICSPVVVPLAGASAACLASSKSAVPLENKRCARDWRQYINKAKAAAKPAAPSFSRLTASPDELARRYGEVTVEAAGIPRLVRSEINWFLSPVELARANLFSSVVESAGLNPTSSHDRARISSTIWSLEIQAGIWVASTGKPVENEPKVPMTESLLSLTIGEPVHPVKRERSKTVRMMNVLVPEEIWRWERGDSNRHSKPEKRRYMYLYGTSLSYTHGLRYSCDFYQFAFGSTG